MSEGHTAPLANRHRRWLKFILAPFVIPIGLVVFLVIGVPLGILAALSIPYYSIYPDRHLHPYDLPHATPRQRELLAKWRSKRRELRLWDRIKRAWLESRRRRAINERREPALMRNFKVRHEEYLRLWKSQNSD